MGLNRVVRGILVAAALIIAGVFGYLGEQAAEHALRSRARAIAQVREIAEQAAEEKRLQQPCAEASVTTYLALVDPALSPSPDRLAVETLGCTPTPQQWRTGEARQAARHREALASRRREELQVERLGQILEAEHRSASKTRVINTQQLAAYKQQLADYQTGIQAALQAAARAKAVADDLGNQEEAARLMLDQKRAALAKLESSFDELEETIKKERPHALPYSAMAGPTPRDPATEITYGSAEDSAKGSSIILHFDEKVHRSQQMVPSVRALMDQVNHYQETYNSLFARRDAQTQEINRMIERANRLSENYNSLLAQYQTQRQ